MILTDSQKQTLADHIRANTDPDVVAALAENNHTRLAELYNLPSTFVIWRNEVTPEEYRDEIKWSEVDTLGGGKARIWSWLTENMTASLDASKNNVRRGVEDAFANATVTRDSLIALCKGYATVAQSVFATGSGTTESPGKARVLGTLSIRDLGDVLNNF